MLHRAKSYDSERSTVGLDVLLNHDSLLNMVSQVAKGAKQF